MRLEFKFNPTFAENLLAGKNIRKTWKLKVNNETLQEFKIFTAGNCIFLKDPISYSIPAYWDTVIDICLKDQVVMRLNCSEHIWIRDDTLTVNLEFSHPYKPLIRLDSI